MGLFYSAFGYNHGAPTKDWIPAHYMNGGFFQRSKAGVMVSEETALYYSAVFACQRAISESFAMLPRDIFQELPANGRREASNHPSAVCLKREANPIQSSYNFFRTAEHHALSSGNAYAELQFDTKGEVIAMWPIPPNRVKPQVIQKENGELDLVYEINFATGEPIYLTKDRMLHIPGLGFDGVRGYPLMQFMLQAIGLGQALEEYSSLFFKQGAGIPGIISVPDSFSQEQIRNMRTQLGNTNEGLENSHRLNFIYESAKFNPAGFSPTDSEMTQSKIFQIQEVARFHRIPLHKIQETSKATGYSSLEQFNIEFVNDTLMPWITNWEQEINRKFFDVADKHYVKFNTNVLLRGDAKSRALFYRTMVFTGIMTPNEARALEDLPPIEGGDKRMIPLNMTEGGENDDKSMNGDERVQD